MFTECETGSRRQVLNEILTPRKIPMVGHLGFSNEGFQQKGSFSIPARGGPCEASAQGVKSAWD